MTDSAEPAATDHSGDANKMVDPFREAARQAAREAVARSEDEQGLIAEWTLATREGRHDDTWPVRYALTGADAALAAVLPIVVNQMAAERDALRVVADAARVQREAAAAVSAMIGHRPVGGDRQLASLDLGAANRALWAALDALPGQPGI